jgi:hypothetical protein
MHLVSLPANSKGQHQRGERNASHGPGISGMHIVLEVHIVEISILTVWAG